MLFMAGRLSVMAVCPETRSSTTRPYSLLLVGGGPLGHPKIFINLVCKSDYLPLS